MRDADRRRRVDWTGIRIFASGIILVIGILNLTRFVGVQNPPHDAGTLVGEILLILIDVGLVISAFRART